MAIERVAAYAAKIYRAGIKSVKNGTKHTTDELKDLLANHTKVGRRLREGVHSAREAVNVKFKKVSDKTENLIGSLERKVNSKGYEAYCNLRKDKEFMRTFDIYRQRRFPNGKIPEIKNDAQFYQELIETLGVGPTKAAQIFSGNPKMLAQIEKKFGPEFVKAMQNTKSGCIPTRTLEEAQQAVSKAFPKENFVVTKQMGTASIGETYLVKRPDGTTGVCKMIKKGVNKQQLEMEEKLLNRLAEEFTDSPKELVKIRGQLKTLYRDWAEELNFTTEMANNKLLAKGAKRFKVADITNISKDGSCIIMDKANGIKMDKLVEILKDYKADPSGFARKYVKEIAENTWLANPERVVKELPSTLLKTFDEQFMFLKKGGKSIMHGDPHTGNFFITADKNGKLIPEFIDTGSCVARTSAQVKDDINFFTNYFVGNSNGVSEYFVKQCGYAGADKDAVVKRIAQDIQENIFGKKHCITKFSDVQTNINAILEKHGLQMSPENATAMKAQMQFFSAVSEAGKLTGQSLDILTLMKDIPKASWNMMKTGTNPYGAVKDALRFAYYNQKQAVGTAYQFTIKDVDKILKSDGTLQAIG